MNLQSFLSMSGYGAYVWSCYALTLAVLLWNLWAARRQLRAALAHAHRRAQAQALDSASRSDTVRDAAPGQNARSATQGEVHP